MNKQIERLNRSRNSLERLGKRLKWVFYAAFAVYCVVLSAIAFFAIFPPAGFEHVGPTSLIEMVPIVCSAGAGGLALFLMGRMLSAIGSGLSPFSDYSVRMITVLGVTLLVGTITGMLVDPGTQVGSTNGASTMAYEFDGAQEGLLYIDAKGLIMSIVCFVLAAAFRYGTILQTEVDDLM